MEVIIRLPIKCVARSMCVCKQWHNLISSVCIPLIKSTLPHALLFSVGTRLPKPVKGPMMLAWLNFPNQDLTSLIDLCHNLPFTPSPLEFLDCCNGSFLFFCRSMAQFFVWNPITEQCLSIPNSPHNDIPATAALFFHPHCKICYICETFPLIVNIFSIQTRRWSVHISHVQPSSVTKKLIMRHVFVDGSLYRVSANGYLLGIDINQLRVQTLELPKVINTKNHPIGCMGKSQDRLHYAWEDRKSQIMVWMLGEGGITDGWVLKYTIPRQYILEHPLYRNSVGFNFCSVLAFDPTSNIFFIGSCMEVFRYDPGNKKLDAVCRLKDGTFICSGQYLVYPFSPSLTTLDAPSQSINN